nr:MULTISPECIES: hypothetical protein [unclassified Coleofasciculus]
MQTKELIIEAGRTEHQYWKDLWRYRELFYFLAWRDILVRYKQTAIGIAWALIRPFLTRIDSVKLHESLTDKPIRYFRRGGDRSLSIASRFTSSRY